MEYLLVLPVSFYRVSATEFACESAFVEHLRKLFHRIPKQFDVIRVSGYLMSDADYERNKSHLGFIQEQAENIFLCELCPKNIRFSEFLNKYSISTFKKIWRLVKSSALVHSGPSMNLFQPVEIFALISAVLQGKKSIAVVDIDIRKDADRAFQLGMINLQRYRLERFVFEPLRHVQLWWVARVCSLVLFKGQALVADYGKGKSSVKNFFDTAHSVQHLIPLTQLQQKAISISAPNRPIHCAYFGRFVARKGIDYCIKAVVAAKRTLNANLEFTVMGDGPEREKLVALVKQLDAESFITIAPPVPFGAELFEKLYGFDILLAAPLTEDTPRSAFDAMASGMALCAFDTDYYSTLAQFGPMVKVSAWLNIDAMAATIAQFDRDRAALVAAQSAAREFAEDNIQERWLEKRLKWTEEFCTQSM